MLQLPAPGRHLVPIHLLVAASRHRDARSHHHNHLPAGDLPLELIDLAGRWTHATWFFSVSEIRDFLCLAAGQRVKTPLPARVGLSGNTPLKSWRLASNPPSPPSPRLRCLVRCFAPESARGSARPKRMPAAPSAAGSAGGVSHGRAFSLLIPSCRPVQALAASQVWRSAMPLKSNRASARASSLSSGRLRITLSCSALRGPQRRLSRRRVTLASPRPKISR
jgi:hypothetical protein